jgi:hypothetical protein
MLKARHGTSTVFLDLDRPADISLVRGQVVLRNPAIAHHPEKVDGLDRPAGLAGVRRMIVERTDQSSVIVLRVWHPDGVQVSSHGLDPDRASCLALLVDERFQMIYEAHEKSILSASSGPMTQMKSLLAFFSI